MAEANRADLTKRQKQVLDRLEKGQKPTTIAKALHMSPNGVYQHRRRLLERGFKVPTNGNGDETPVPARRRATASSNGRPSDVPKVVADTIKVLDAQGEDLDKALTVNAHSREDVEDRIAQANKDLEGLKVEQERLHGAQEAVHEAREKVPA